MIFSSRSRATAQRRVSFILALALAALPAAVSAATRHAARARKEASREVIFKGAIVIDAATGQVLAEDNADEVSPPASMTKLMTFAVLYDKLASGQLKLDQQVQIDRSDARMGGTQVYLDPRESFSVEDLIYAMMIQSANDAAHALARVSAGSIEAFVEEMNAKARQIGMTHSTFRSPHGLPPSDRQLADSDLTTPRDYAMLCRYLLLHTDILRYTSVRERDFGLQRTHGPVHMINHNKLLGKVAGVDGLKTGYTAKAGYCLSATAERNGHRVVVVIMGAMGAGGHADFGRARDIKAMEYLEKGFAAIPGTEQTFDSERAKFVKPAEIPLDAAAASAARPADRARIGTSAVPAVGSDPTASVHFSLPTR